MDRFWSKVDKRGPDECWPWTAGKLHFGHGAFTVKRRPIAAHRMSWMITNGPIPDGMCVLHHCDNPSCCNPSHLFIGTKTDNNKDRDSKNRQAQGLRSGRYTKPHRNAVGVRNGRAKLSEHHIEEIKELRSGGFTLSAIASNYGLGTSQVWRIVRGQSWKCLNGPR